MVFWLEQQGYDVSYTRRRRRQPEPDAASSSTRSIIDRRPQRVLVARGVQRLQGGARRRRERRLVQRQHRLLEGPPTRTATARSSATRPSRAPAPPATGRRRPTTRAPTASRAPPTTRSVPTASPAPPTTIPRTRPRRAATTARRPATPTRRPADASVPNEPENSLCGNMYVGDNDSNSLPVERPGRQRQRRVRGRPHLAQHRDPDERRPRTSARTLVGWEWDAIPTQAQYLAQPAGRRQAPELDQRHRPHGDSWLQDEGRAARHHAAAGPAGHRQRGQVPRAERRAGVRGGHDAVVARPRRASPRSSRRPTTSSPTWASSPTRRTEHHARPGRRRTSHRRLLHGSRRPRSTSASPGHVQRLRVQRPRRHDHQVRVGSRRQRHLRDRHRHDADAHAHVHDRGHLRRAPARSPTTAAHTDFTTRTVTLLVEHPADRLVHGSPEPGRSSARPSRFNGSASSDPDGTIAKYEWDLDGNGTYETNTGTTQDDRQDLRDRRHRTRRPAVTDNGGEDRHDARVPVTVNSGGVSQLRRRRARHARPAATTGAWARPPARRSPTARARAPRTLTGATLRRPGRPSPATPNTAARFDGGRRAIGRGATVDLSDQHAITVEFWLKWNALRQRRLAGDGVHAELQRQRRRLPRRSERARSRRHVRRRHRAAARSRNNVFFARPSAGAWHHYAFVIDTTAPAATQITPYVDGAGRDLHEGRAAAPARASSRTRRCTSCRAPAPRCSAAATSTRSRSTTRALTASDDRRPLQLLRHRTAGPVASFTTSPEPGRDRARR